MTTLVLPAPSGQEMKPHKPQYLPGRLFAEQRRKLVEGALQATGGNVTEAAGKIGIHRITFHKMLGRARKERH